MTKTLKFLESKKVPSRREDAAEFYFYFSLINTKLIGSPEEKSETRQLKIKVSISGILEAIWKNQNETLDIEKVLFEYGKRHIINKIKENSNIEEDELWLATNTAPSNCPFDSSYISNQIGETFEIVIGEAELMSDNSLIKIATSIIETRDYINAIIKEKLNTKLFIVKNERDLLQLFISASSSEEFTYRLSGLKNIVVNMSEELLRESTNIQDTNIKSISLFDEFLKTYQNYEENIARVFRNINRLRQAYPIHGDNIDGVQEAHKFFDITYPIVKYNDAWKKLLVNYLDSLKRILEIITSQNN